jgi:hypothetical protein
MKKIAQFVSLALATLTMFVVATATAQTTSSAGNGLKISPVRSDLTIAPGTSQTVTVNVQNVTAASATFRAVVNDFIAGEGETGQPSLILDEGKFADSRSLKRYISDIPNVQIGAGETKQVKVEIDIPKDAAGGGYFGAVRFVPVSSDAADKNVTLSASVGSIMLVKVPGDIKSDLTIASFDVRSAADSNAASSFYTNGDSLFGVVRFENKGNVQEQPFGKILLKKGGTVLQTSEINNTDPKGNVLPDSIRRFSVPLEKVGGFGKYTIEGNFGYGADGKLLTATSTFYVIPVPLIAGVAVAVALLVAAVVFVPRAIKRYNQRILRRSGRR